MLNAKSYTRTIGTGNFQAVLLDDQTKFVGASDIYEELWRKQLAIFLGRFVEKHGKATINGKTVEDPAVKSEIIEDMLQYVRSPIPEKIALKEYEEEMKALPFASRTIAAFKLMTRSPKSHL